jgi:hypothetical protein
MGRGCAGEIPYPSVAEDELSLAATEGDNSVPSARE